MNNYVTVDFMAGDTIEEAVKTLQDIQAKAILAKGEFNGKIILVMGNGLTQLTEQQVKDLYIDVYDLQDFDYEDYKKAYS